MTSEKIQKLEDRIKKLETTNITLAETIVKISQVVNALVTKMELTHDEIIDEANSGSSDEKLVQSEGAGTISNNS